MTDWEQRNRDAVDSAARRMDEIKPGWWKSIDPLKLNLASASDCICGQSGLDWKDVSGYTPGGHLVGLALDFASCFSSRSKEPYWLEEIAKRIPSPTTTPYVGTPVGKVTA